MPEGRWDKSDVKIRNPQGTEVIAHRLLLFRPKPAFASSRLGSVLEYVMFAVFSTLVGFVGAWWHWYAELKNVVHGRKCDDSSLQIEKKKTDNNRKYWAKTHIIYLDCILIGQQALALSRFVHAMHNPGIVTVEVMSQYFGCAQSVNLTTMKNNNIEFQFLKLS